MQTKNRYNICCLFTMCRCLFGCKCCIQPSQLSGHYDYCLHVIEEKSKTDTEGLSHLPYQHSSVRISFGFWLLDLQSVGYCMLPDMGLAWAAVFPSSANTQSRFQCWNAWFQDGPKKSYGQERICWRLRRQARGETFKRYLGKLPQIPHWLCFSSQDSGHLVEGVDAGREPRDLPFPLELLLPFTSLCSSET